MSPTLPAEGEVQSLVRTLAANPDPLRLYGALCGGGAMPDTALLESADIKSRTAERSFVFPRAALRAECRGSLVEITALTPNGMGALDGLAADLASRGAVERRGATVVATYPPPAARASEAARLDAPSPFDALRALALRWKMIADPAPQIPIAVGAFAYDLIDCFERLPAAAADPLGAPDFLFWVPELAVAINHRLVSMTVLARVFGGPSAAQAYHDLARAADDITRAALAGGLARDEAAPAARPRWEDIPADTRCDTSDEEFALLVGRLKERIVAGDVFQIVPSRTFTASCADPLAAYGRLRRLNPSPYMFFLRGQRQVLLGASPETAVKVSGAPRQVEICPIAGTAARGRDAAGAIDLDLDGRLEAELRLSEKELAEHMMLIDLARNDVARVSRPGTRHTPDILSVDRYSHVMHLASRVSGELRPGLDALHVYAATMNMGTLVGAPKIKAAGILRQNETTRRGLYGGAVAAITADGEMDSAIVIRSAQVVDGLAHVRAGAGVVYDSDPRAEAAETRRKAQAALRALVDDAGAAP